MTFGTINKRRKRGEAGAATLMRSARNEEDAQYDWAAIDEESNGYLHNMQDNERNSWRMAGVNILPKGKIR